MDYPTIAIIISITLTCAHILTTTLFRRKSGTTTRLPPGPYPLPVVGNIFQLGSKPHQSLAHLSKIYGPLMSLKLGSKTTIVISSPKIAKEILQKHDLAFSSRSPPATAKTLGYGDTSIIWSPVGNLWRNHRKICKEHIFATNRLDATQSLRKKIVKDLVDYANECCLKGEAMNVIEVGHTTTLNLLSNFFFSVDFAQHHSVSFQEFKDTLSALVKIAGKPNISDFFPILESFDLQGIQRKTSFYLIKLHRMLDKIIDQRLQERSSSGDASSMCNDALDSMLILHLKNDSDFSRNELRGLILDLLIAGTDTTSSTIEWAMTELLRNPEKMVKARSELKQVIGKVGGVIEESDISKLPYLQAIVKEILRLHPPAPFLIPRKAKADVEIEGLAVPKNADILVNIWASGRDSSVWVDAESFMPERFIGSEIDFKGQHLELIPFGAGRRICPGLPLGHKMLHLILGSLLHSSDWKLQGDKEAKDMDMGEIFGITVKKAISLQVIPIKLL